MTGKARQAKTKDLVKSYEPTSRELTALEAHTTRQEEAPPAPRMVVTQSDGAPIISPDHPELQVGSALLMEALGTSDGDFARGLILQLANAGTQGQRVDEGGLNFMLSVVKGIEPADQVEAMVAAQMAAVHMATMTFARRLAHVENIPQQDSAERAFNKLARTFAAQIEALKRYRGKGEQKVTVEHVHVHAGGQAIVGEVTTGIRGEGPPEKTEERAHAQRTVTYRPGTPLRSQDAVREAVPVPGGSRTA